MRYIQSVVFSLLFSSNQCPSRFVYCCPCFGIRWISPILNGENPGSEQGRLRIPLLDRSFESFDTVDGQNPAPPMMKIIPLLIGF